MNFELVPEMNFAFLSVAQSARGPGGLGISNQANFKFEVRDTSYETNQQSPVLHKFDVHVGWEGGRTPEGWQLSDATNPIAQSQRGNVFPQNFQVQLISSKVPEIEVHLQLVVTMRSYYDVEGAKELSLTKVENFTARVAPGPALLMQVYYEGTPGDGNTPLRATPDSWIPVRINVSNADLYVARVIVSITVEPGDKVDPQLVAVRGTGVYVLEPNSTQDINLMLLTPKQTTWYRGDQMQFNIRVSSADNPTVGVSSDVVVAIEGWYLSQSLRVLVPILLLLLVLFIIILLAGKRYYEEKVLGKPIPPWRIPEEAAALDLLRREDPREFYVTRYFLMEEEHASALAWFYGYKRRSKKQIKRESESARLFDKAQQLKEPTLTRFDRRAARIKKKFHRRQERRRLKLEAKIEGLETKLAKHYEEDFEKDHEKWEAKVEKLKAKANKPWYRAHKKWEKDVEKAMAAWEKPFAKDKAKREKEIAKAKEKYAAQVKKKDKDTWRAWREDVEANEKENKIREKEGRDPLPEPLLTSAVVGPAEIPKPFREPPKPKLPPEPTEPVIKDLPPEPKLDKPKLEDSHYAKKAKRLRKKTDRKVARLERKMERALARNERDRVKAIGKSGKKREKYLRKSHRYTQPTLMQRLFKQTPEDREHRAHKKLLKALAKERVKALAEAEKGRLEVLRVDAERREAELTARLVREQATVRKSGGSASMQIEKAPELLALREENERRLAKERLASNKKIAAEKEQAEAELRKQLTEELVQERVKREAAKDKKAADQLAKAEAKKSAKAEVQEQESQDEEPPAPAPKAKRGKK